MKYDIFISYSRKDLDEVVTLFNAIRSQIPDLSFWFDLNGVESGDEFEDKIISAIDNSSYVLFALSENSIESPWAKDEVMYAKNTDKKVIPVLLKGSQMKGWFLFKFGRIDCIDSQDTAQFDKLVSNLSSWTGKPMKNAPSIPIPPVPTPPVPTPPIPTPPPVPNTEERTWKVGDYYDVDGKRGVVFMVDMNGRHGKIIGLEQVLLQWCVEEQMPQAVDTAVSHKTDGAANLRAVMELDGWRDNYPAFAWCACRGDGWYLPSINELKELMTRKEVREKVNATLKRKGLLPLFSLGHLKKFYWSSTSCNQQKAYILRADFLYPSDERKDSFCYVRAVSVF